MPKYLVDFTKSCKCCGNDFYRASGEKAYRFRERSTCKKCTSARNDELLIFQKIVAETFPNGGVHGVMKALTLAGIIRSHTQIRGTIRKIFGDDAIIEYNKAAGDNIVRVPRKKNNAITPDEAPKGPADIFPRSKLVPAGRCFTL